MNLAEKLQSLMKEKELRKSDVARDTGIPYTTLDGILKRSDFSKIKLDTIQILGNYFDVTLDYLMIDEITEKTHGKLNQDDKIADFAVKLMLYGNEAQKKLFEELGDAEHFTEYELYLITEMIRTIKRAKKMPHH